LFPANLQQVHPKNPEGKDYDSWILFLRLGSDTKVEKAIRDKYAEIYQILASQNVNYSEITTFKGKQDFYNRFNHEMDEHPLFFVFNKYPLKYAKKEPFLVIEWGKWKDIDTLRNDLMRFVSFFSNKEFRIKIANAKNREMWSTVVNILKHHGLDFLKIGFAIASSISS
jgi:hypothetical protein